MKASWAPVCDDSDLAAGQMRRVHLAGCDVLLCRTTEGWHALDLNCPHAEQPMDEGRLRGNRLTCPLHGASFDVRTGESLGRPVTGPIGVHAVRLRDGRVEIALRGSLEAQATDDLRRD
jgi:3-phenylpropionate/trans-cinnamate dioxygenase ferredoxin subunit